jgi:hypothetical protein
MVLETKRVTNAHEEAPTSCTPETNKGISHLLANDRTPRVMYIGLKQSTTRVDLTAAAGRGQPSRLWRRRMEGAGV